MLDLSKIFTVRTKENIFFNIIIGLLIAGLIYFLTPATMIAVMVQIIIGVIIMIVPKYTKTKKSNFFGMFAYLLGSVAGIMLVGVLFV